LTTLDSLVYNDTCTVFFLPHLDGGGSTFGQDVVRFARERIGPVGHALEWCSGPGFIGLSLLANGLCDRLTLCDINPEAVEVANETVRRNDLGDRVEVFRSDCLDAVPPRQLDLVVANPPHTAGDRLFPKFGPEILYRDPDWAAHRRFYRAVGDYLAPGGSVLIQENGLFSRVADFATMIDEAGLELVESSPSLAQYYFVWSRKPADAAGAGAGAGRC
jgi:methylase of polypeptide subunit release factors